MRTEIENQQSPALFLIVAVAVTALFFWPRAGGVQHGGLTVRAETYAPVMVKKGQIKPVWEVEDFIFESIKKRLADRPAKFKR